MPRKKLTAKTADKHILYEKSVQNSEFDAEFVAKNFKKLRQREAITLKEDFCGTFNFCCEWLLLNKKHQALGVDIDRPTLDWGIKNNLPRLDEEQQKRLKIKCANVLEVSRPQVDVVTAFNFSYFLFTERSVLLKYFKTARRSLVKDGALFLDCFGGSEAYLELEERRKIDGFTYVWEHASFHPVTSQTICKIHFEFPDGTAMRNAFVYTWRQWGMTEIRELLVEAGFREVIVYWEGTDSETGEGNGVFRVTKKGEPCESWIAYIVALK